MLLFFQSKCDLLHCEAGKQVCGGDGVTYSSFCELQKQECIQDKDIKFECDGSCPCGMFLKVKI